MGRGARRHAGERALDHLAFPEQPLQPARHPPVGGRLLRFLIIGVIILLFSQKVKGASEIFSKKSKGQTCGRTSDPGKRGGKPPSVNATYLRFGIIGYHISETMLHGDSLSKSSRLALLQQHRHQAALHATRHPSYDYLAVLAKTWSWPSGAYTRWMNTPGSTSTDST